MHHGEGDNDHVSNCHSKVGQTPQNQPKEVFQLPFPVLVPGFHWLQESPTSSLSLSQNQNKFFRSLLEKQVALILYFVQRILELPLTTITCQPSISFCLIGHSFDFSTNLHNFTTSFICQIYFLYLCFSPCLQFLGFLYYCIK